MIESMSFTQSQTNFTGLPCSYIVVGRDKGGIKAEFGWKENEGFWVGTLFCLHYFYFPFYYVILIKTN